MQDYYNSDELMHYGRKGMKWGQNIFGKVKSGADKAYSFAKKVDEKRKVKKTEEIKAKRSKITSSRKLTDDELRERIKRLELEKQYVDLRKDTRAISKGETFAASVLESIGKNLITQVGNHYGSKALNKLIGEEVIFANNKKK